MLAYAGEASAFCRTTTCDPKDPSQGCALNAELCETTGIPLYWPDACLSFSVNQAGTERRQIDWRVTSELVTQAFHSWTEVDCGGHQPSISLRGRSPVACDAQEFNQRGPNANIWMYRDDGWPYPGSDTTLALTTVTYNTRTGEIYDADVEINSANNQLTTGDTEVVSDLLSILTHEAGHFLGLAHTTRRGATMFAEYLPGSTSLRQLSSDDVAGICAVYPAGRSARPCDYDPRHGFATECDQVEESGCSCALPGAHSERRLGQHGALLGVGLLVGAAYVRRRRRRAAS